MAYPAGGGADGAKSNELLNILGEVKARVQDKLGIVGFPMPQFIVVGKQSVGKSRLVEALAGETFNFISGTLGSRRPTQLEFRHVPTNEKSRWYLRVGKEMKWEEMPASQLMEEVGKRHEECGKDVKKEPVYVRLESKHCADMQLVDLPGFREFALNPEDQGLQKKIEELVMSYMRDKNNVMLCVEQAGDAATMSTLGRCRDIDPNFNRTMLIRNKLDKYYGDLTGSNIDKWVQGYGDLPDDLNRPVRFALTLPFWKDGEVCPGDFVKMRNDKANEDQMTMETKGLNKKYMEYIGMNNFMKYLEQKIEVMFSEALTPVLTNLQNMKKDSEKEIEALKAEYVETDPQRTLSITRDCGVSFATALTHVMEGVLGLTPVMNLDDELKAFQEYHKALGSKHLEIVPSEDFSGLDDYIDFLRTEMEVATFDVEINGGAQYRRLMNEVEIFLRFAEIATELKKKDVIQARGVSLTSLGWRDVVVKLLMNEAHLPLLRRVNYVGERIKWFFVSQKDAVLTFMEQLEGTPSGHVFSPLYPKHAKLIRKNEIIKKLVFVTYDNVAQKQLTQFIDLFENMLTATFANPWVFLKGSTPTDEDEFGDDENAALPDLDETKGRIPKEIQNRSKVDDTIATWLGKIPTASHEIDEAVNQVQMVLLKTYGFIRSQVCDQVELFAESFFKLPMLRRLEEDMAQIELSESDQRKYAERRADLGGQIEKHQESLKEVTDCINRLVEFKVSREAM